MDIQTLAAAIKLAGRGGSGGGESGGSGADDSIYALFLDGTKETYHKVMRSFFAANGAQTATPAELTALCDRWYTLTRTGWDGGVRFYQPDVSAVSEGEKTGDNAGLTCVPSTNTVAGQDDYAGLPLFAIVDVNWVVDAQTLEPMITAIDGINDWFERGNPEKFVGVMQMSGYRYFLEDEQTYTYGYCDSLKSYARIEPVAEAVRPSDSSVRPWVVHGKYMASVEDGKLTCYSGVIPTAWVSTTNAQTYAKAQGAQYSGGCGVDIAWLHTMAQIKYGSLTQDGINQGCVAYNYQYPAAVAESGVQRVLLTEAQAANMIVGSSVIIGNYAGSLDRGDAGMSSITGRAGAIITGKEAVTIGDAAYVAINVDCAAFDTAANGAATEGTTYITTWHWRTGACDSVLGNDGAPDAPGGGKYPAMIQGIEYSVGGYDAGVDVILNNYQDADGAYWVEPYTVNRTAKQAGSLTADYKATGIVLALPEANGWQYIVRNGYADGIFFAAQTGGSSTTYTRDAIYLNVAQKDAMALPAFGHLLHSVGPAGLSCVLGINGLSVAIWYRLARLSPNGNRGEWTA